MLWAKVACCLRRQLPAFQRGESIVFNQLELQNLNLV
jgi:hypothetical protein